MRLKCVGLHDAPLTMIDTKLTRPRCSGMQSYSVGDLVVDGSRRQVTRDGQEIALGGLTFDLLYVLACEAPGFVSNDELMRRVWPKLVVGPETVSQRVKRLRDALGDDSKSPRYIEAMRGRGYRLIAPTAMLAGAAAMVPSLTTRELPAAARGLRIPRWIALAGLGVLLVAAGLWVVALQHRPGAASHTQSALVRNPAAERLYLRAVALGHSGSTRNSIEAFQLLDQAIELDPRFARALAYRARGHMIFAAMGNPVPHVLEDAERDAGEALGIDPNLADGHWALGVNDAARGNWLSSEGHFRRAIALSPSEPELRADYAVFVLETAGRLRAAIAASDDAYRLAPTSPFIRALAAAAYSFAGQDHEALSLLVTTQPDEPHDTQLPSLILGTAAVRAGRFDEAADRVIPTLASALRTSGGDAVLRKLYSTIATSAARPAAVAALREWLGKLRRNEFDPAAAKVFITVLAQNGRLDDAFAIADRLLDELGNQGTVGDAWGLLWTPELSAFRRDPRFQRLVERLKLPDYWRHVGPPDACRFEADQLDCS